MRQAVLALLAGYALACNGPTAISENRVRVQAEGDRAEVTNGRSDPLHTFAVGRNLAAVINWAPCAGPSCDAIPPGATRRVGISLREEDDEDEAILHWWHSVPAEEGGYEPDSVRSIVFPL